MIATAESLEFKHICTLFSLFGGPFKFSQPLSSLFSTLCKLPSEVKIEASSHQAEAESVKTSLLLFQISRVGLAAFDIRYLGPCNLEVPPQPKVKLVSQRSTLHKVDEEIKPQVFQATPARHELLHTTEVVQVPEVGEDSASPYSDTESARQPNFSRPLKHDQRVPRFLGRHVVTPPYHSPASTVRSISFGSLEERHGSAYTVSRNRPINFSRPPSIPPRTVSLLDGAFESFSSTPTSLSRASSFESVPVHLRIRQQSSDPLYVGLNQESRVQRPPTDNSSEAEQRSLRSTRILTVESPSSFTRPHQTPFTGPYAYDQSTEMHTIGYRRQPAKPLQPRRIPIFTARAVYPPSMAANALVRDYSAETVYGGSEAGDNVANPEEHLYHHVAGASFTARPGALQRATGGTIVSSPAADPASASALAEFPAVDLMVGVVNMDHDEFRACLDGAGPAHPNPAASSVPLRSDEPKRGPCRRLLAAVCPCVG
ncbi:MAG: hypothetical protein M1833_002074 [Piccolia ochrophora]|nr:MAG: hypothetical protein M1833_002074 [Piccolia ochrophora]